MKRRVLSVLLTAALIISVVPVFPVISRNVFADDHVHDYSDNGICSCGFFEPATLVTADNAAGLGLGSGYIGYYAISNAGQLYWFAGLVNGKLTAEGGLAEVPVAQNKSANAVLAQNITVNPGSFDSDGNYTEGENLATPRAWTSIGDNLIFYKGTFDGNGKTVSGLYMSNDDGSASLIGNMYEPASLKNLRLSKSFLRGSTAAGFVSSLSSNSSVCNCETTDSVTIIGSTGAAGGIVRDAQSGSIYNCKNAAAVTGNSYTGGIVAINPKVISGCLNVGTVRGNYAFGVYCGAICGINSSSLNISNSYYLAGSATSANGGTVYAVASNADELGVGAEALASGEVCWKLNGSQSEDNEWLQTLSGDSADSMPVLKTFSPDSGFVYYNGADYTNHVHIYGDAVYSWAADNSACTASKTCTDADCGYISTKAKDAAGETCKKCGRVVRTGAKFCPGCGSPMNEAKEVTSFEDIVSEDSEE